MIQELFQLLKESILSPKKYLNNIIENNITRHQLLLLVLIGIITGLDNDMTKYFTSDMSLWVYLLQSILAGGILGWVGMYFLAYTVALVGSFFKSKAHGDSILNVLAYAYLPMLLVLMIVILEFVLYSIIGYTSDYAALITFLAVVKLLVFVYSFVLAVTGIAKVQALPLVKALISVLVPAIVFTLVFNGILWFFK